MHMYIQNDIFYISNWLVVEPTHLKNMIVKLEHFPRKSVWKKKIFALPPPCHLSLQVFPVPTLDVSENSGFSPQIIHLFIGFSLIKLINHLFWGIYPIFGNTQYIYIYIFHTTKTTSPSKPSGRSSHRSRETPDQVQPKKWHGGNSPAIHQGCFQPKIGGRNPLMIGRCHWYKYHKQKWCVFGHYHIHFE